MIKKTYCNDFTSQKNDPKYFSECDEILLLDGASSFLKQLSRAA